MPQIKETKAQLMGQIIDQKVDIEEKDKAILSLTTDLNNLKKRYERMINDNANLQDYNGELMAKLTYNGAECEKRVARFRLERDEANNILDLSIETIGLISEIAKKRRAK